MMLNNGFLGFPHNQLNWSMNVALFLNKRENKKDGTKNGVEIMVIKQYKVHCSGYSFQECGYHPTIEWKRTEHIKSVRSPTKTDTQGRRVEWISPSKTPSIEIQRNKSGTKLATTSRNFGQV